MDTIWIWPCIREDAKPEIKKVITQKISIEAGKNRLFGLPDENGNVGDPEEKKGGKRVITKPKGNNMWRVKKDYLAAISGSQAVKTSNHW